MTMRPEELAEELLLQRRRRARERVGRRVGERRAEAEDLLALVLRPHGGGEIALREAIEAAKRHLAPLQEWRAAVRAGRERRCRHEHDGGVVAQRRRCAAARRSGRACSACRAAALALRAARARGASWRPQARWRTGSARRRRSWRPQRAASSVAPTPACRARRTASRTCACVGPRAASRPRLARDEEASCEREHARSGSSRGGGLQRLARGADVRRPASERAVFIVALGRSGSSHLLHLLNAIPGYRVSGETENAWLHLARHARAAPKPAAAALPLCEAWEPFSERARARGRCGWILTARHSTGPRFSRLVRRRGRRAWRRTAVTPR